MEKQVTAKWGEGFLSKLSRDLMAEFPDMKGFSKRNSERIRQWYLFYNQKSTIVKQPVSQLETRIGQQAVAQITQGTWDTLSLLFPNVRI